MEVTTIIQEIDKLEPVDKKRVMSHMVLRRLQENAAFREEMTRRIDDKNPDNWVSLEELKKRWEQESDGGV